MKTKNIAISIMCILMLFVLTGCVHKKPISIDEFKTKTTSLDYTIVSLENNNGSIPSKYQKLAQESVAARSTKGYRIEFYVFEDRYASLKCFNEVKTKLDTNTSKLTQKTRNNIGNFSSFAITINGYYTYVGRVENTLIYVKTKTTNKNEVKKLMSELGYTLVS